MVGVSRRPYSWEEAVSTLKDTGFRLRRLLALADVVALVAATLLAPGLVLGGPGTTERVSVDSAGGEGNGPQGSFSPDISADGRYVAFSHSDSSNLVPGDTNGLVDVFVHDRQTGTTERVSVDSRGPRRTPTAASRRSAPTAASSPSLRRLEPRAGRHERHQLTSSSTTGRPAPPSGSASTAAASRRTTSSHAGDQRRRPLRRLRLVRVEPGPGDTNGTADSSSTTARPA